MPIKIVEDENRFFLVFETKWHGTPKTLGVAGAPRQGFATRAEAVAAKKKVSILRSAGISSAMYTP
jgi:hypothetical protein